MARIIKIIGGGILVGSSHIAMAQDTGTTSVAVDVSAGGAVGTNPFLVTGDDTAAASATLEISPEIYIEDERGQVVIAGQFRLSQYTRRYGSDDAERIGIAARRVLDERTTLSSDASFQSSRRPFQDALLSGFGNSLQPGSPLNSGGNGLPQPIDFIDPTIAGMRDRVSSVNSGINIQHRLTPVSEIGGGISSNYTFYGDGIGVDFTSVAFSGNYSRQLWERVTGTVDFRAEKVNYLGRQIGDTKIFTPQVGARIQLSESMTLNASVGTSFVVTDVGFGENEKSVALAGNVSFCRTGLRDALCFSASRNATPTALGSVTTSTTVVANYDLRLSATDRISVVGRFGRTQQRETDPLLAAFPDTNLVGLSANYVKEINDRFSVYVTPSYTKFFEDQLSRDANFSLMAGVTYRIGQRR